MKTELEANMAVEKDADTVRRICFVYLKNEADVEDIFQDVFLKFILRDKPFESDVHEKAWLIRISINACKDLTKSFFRKKVSSLEELTKEPFYSENIDTTTTITLEAVMKLEQNYRNVVYLFYYEGYTAVEIARILNKKENTVYTWLSRARNQLKEMLGGESFEN